MSPPTSLKSKVRVIPTSPEMGPSRYSMNKLGTYFEPINASGDSGNAKALLCQSRSNCSPNPCRGSCHNSHSSRPAFHAHAGGLWLTICGKLLPQGHLLYVPPAPLLLSYHLSSIAYAVSIITWIVQTVYQWDTVILILNLSHTLELQIKNIYKKLIYV